MIASLVLRVLVDLFDLGHCARIVATPHGHRCAQIRIPSASSIDAPGWHVVFGAAVCSHHCPDGAPTR